MKQQYVYKTTVSEFYGLTPSMIQELGEPDRECDNPHYKSGPPASLYLKERVEAWVEENRERVKEAQARRLKRWEKITAAQEKERAERRERTREWVQTVPIQLDTPFPTSFVEYAAVCHKADPLQRNGLHSYVRHHLTNHNALRSELRNRGFFDELYPLLIQRVDAHMHAALSEWRDGLSPDWYVRADPTLRHKTAGFKELETKLLAAGGRSVVLDTPEEYLDLLLERGRLFDQPKTRSLPGKRDRCHGYNTTLHYQRGDGTYQIVTGYRLARGGTWQQHSWLWDGSQVLVTPFTMAHLYFGVVLEPAETASFIRRALSGSEEAGGSHVP